MTCLVTGATGLVGSALVRTLYARGDSVVAAARNAEKAQRLFGTLPRVHVVEWDVTRPFDITQLSRLPGFNGMVDGIVHAAAETTSRNMVERPVETITVTVEGTRNALELARRLKVRGMVYLSSLEIYGLPQDGEPISEEDLGPLDIMSPRSSYPLSKRAAEGYCAAYAREYGIPARIARLAQVVGEEIAPDDNRVIAQLARAAASGGDMVLHTDGASAHCYCAVSDAVGAILLLLERGVPGEAYNVANASTYCSIRELAEYICAAHPPSRLRIKHIDGMGYAPNCKLRLSTAKIERLGWHPAVGLAEMFERLIGNCK